jgi:DNA-directed RNA polymerase subunit E'/Rpb7
MYLKTRLVDTVRIDPEQLGMPIMASVRQALRDKLGSLSRSSNSARSSVSDRSTG